MTQRRLSIALSAASCNAPKDPVDSLQEPVCGLRIPPSAILSLTKLPQKLDASEFEKYKKRDNRNIRTNTTSQELSGGKIRLSVRLQ